MRVGDFVVMAPDPNAPGSYISKNLMGFQLNPQQAGPSLGQSTPDMNAPLDRGPGFSQNLVPSGTVAGVAKATGFADQPIPSWLSKEAQGVVRSAQVNPQRMVAENAVAQRVASGGPMAMGIDTATPEDQAAFSRMLYNPQATSQERFPVVAAGSTAERVRQAEANLKARAAGQQVPPIQPDVTGPEFKQGVVQTEQGPMPVPAYQSIRREEAMRERAEATQQPAVDYASIAGQAGKTWGAGTLLNTIVFPERPEGLAAGPGERLMPRKIVRQADSIVGRLQPLQSALNEAEEDRQRVIEGLKGKEATAGQRPTLEKADAQVEKAQDAYNAAMRKLSGRQKDIWKWFDTGKIPDRFKNLQNVSQENWVPAHMDAKTGKLVQGKLKEPEVPPEALAATKAEFLAGYRALAENPGTVEEIGQFIQNLANSGVPITKEFKNVQEAYALANIMPGKTSDWYIERAWKIKPKKPKTLDTIRAYGVVADWIRGFGEADNWILPPYNDPERVRQFGDGKEGRRKSLADRFNKFIKEHGDNISHEDAITIFRDVASQRGPEDRASRDWQAVEQGLPKSQQRVFEGDVEKNPVSVKGKPAADIDDPDGGKIPTEVAAPSAEPAVTNQPQLTYEQAFTQSMVASGGEEEVFKKKMIALGFDPDAEK